MVVVLVTKPQPRIPIMKSPQPFEPYRFPYGTLTATKKSPVRIRKLPVLSGDHQDPPSVVGFSMVSRCFL